jgi:hypothetical protein
MELYAHGPVLRLAGASVCAVEGTMSKGGLRLRVSAGF